MRRYANHVNDVNEIKIKFVLAGTQMNLLPKPPAAATAYALIPIQSGLPVMSSKPYIVQPLADSGSGSGISGTFTLEFHYK